MNRRHGKRRIVKNKPKTKEDKSLDRRIAKIEHNIETKFVQDTVYNKPSDDPIYMNGTIYLLNGALNGDGQNNRTGAKISCTSVHIRGHIHPQYPTVPTEARLILLWDRQTNGAFPPVLRTVGGEQAIIDDTADPFNNVVHSPLYFANKHRYTVLWDKTYVMKSYNDSNTSVEAIVINKYKKLNRITGYNGGSTGLIADVQTNGLYLLTLGNFASPAATAPNFYFVSETRFRDA